MFLYLTQIKLTVYNLCYTNSNDKDTTVLDSLLECIDRNYSYFNPKLLAIWTGPIAWKAQAMAKALKLCTLSI